MVHWGVELDDRWGPRTVKAVHWGLELDDKWGPRTVKAVHLTVGLDDKWRLSHQSGSLGGGAG